MSYFTKHREKGVTTYFLAGKKPKFSPDTMVFLLFLAVMAVYYGYRMFALVPGMTNCTPTTILSAEGRSMRQSIGRCPITMWDIPPFRPVWGYLDARRSPCVVYPIYAAWEA